MCLGKMIREDDGVLERVRGLRQSGVIYLRNGVFFFPSHGFSGQRIIHENGDRCSWALGFH